MNEILELSIRGNLYYFIDTFSQKELAKIREIARQHFKITSTAYSEDEQLDAFIRDVRDRTDISLVQARIKNVISI